MPFGQGETGTCVEARLKAMPSGGGDDGGWADRDLI